MLDWLVWPFKKIRYFAKYIAETRIGHFFRTLVGRVLLSLIYVILAVISFWLFPGLDEVKLIDGLTTEFLGMFFILLVIDYYRDREATKQAELKETEAREHQERREQEALQNYKDDLVRQARSRNNNNALDAIDIIRERGWLDGNKDGVKLLEGISLKNADLSNADLSNGQLQRTEFIGKAKLNKVDFSGASLRNAKFISAQLSETIFVGTDLVGTDFTHARLFCCLFQKDQTTERKEALFTVPDDPQIVVFDNAELKGGSLEEEDGNERETEIDLRGLKLNGASFVNAKLIKIRLDRAWLQGCNFTEVFLDDVYFDEAHLERARFVTIENNRPQFKKINSISFREAHLQGADLRSVSFIDVDFSGANLSDANCTNASFSGGTDFQNAILFTEVTGAIFQDVKFNGKTVFFNGEELQLLWEKSRRSDGEADEKAFLSKIEDIARSEKIKTLFATIEIVIYDERDVFLEIVDGEEIYQTIWQPTDKSQTIRVNYSQKS